MTRLRTRLCLIAAGLLFGGCAPEDRHQIRVEARSDAAFASWRAKVDPRFRLDDWREFDAILQELRLEIMAKRQASGHDAIEAALRTLIDGRTFGEVLRRGYEAKSVRVDRERADLQQVLHTNAWLVTKPGDRSSSDYLAGLRERQQRRLAGVLADQAAAEKRIVELGGKVPAPSRAAEAPPADPPPLSAAEGRQHFAAMLGETRTTALLRLGSAPLTIDREGAGLPEDERAEFLQRRATAAAAGRITLAVRLHDRWWTYEGPAAGPELPAFVTAHFTTADREEVTRQWQDLQAELWARRSALAGK